MFNKLRQKQGQSTLEYIILITAVIVVVIGLVVAKESPFRKTLNTTFDRAINKVDSVSDAWDTTVKVPGEVAAPVSGEVAAPAE